MKKAIPNGLFCLLMAACLAGLWSGCDGDSGSSSSPIWIEPAKATLTTNDNHRTLILTAVGGLSPLTWSVSDPSMGSVSGAQSGADRRVTYTRTDKNGANIVRVVDAHGWAAEAAITQKGATPTAQKALAVVPSSATVAATNGFVQLQAVGGSGAYNWGIGTAPASGYLTQTTGSSTFYFSTGSAQDVVWVSDGNDTVYSTIAKEQ